MITPVSKLLRLLLNLSKPFSKPYGPDNYLEPLCKILIVCPPNHKDILFLFICCASRSAGNLFFILIVVTSYVLFRSLKDVSSYKVCQRGRVGM